MVELNILTSINVTVVKGKVTTTVRTPVVQMSRIHKATMLYTIIQMPNKVIKESSITEIQIWNANIFGR